MINFIKKLFNPRYYPQLSPDEIPLPPTRVEAEMPEVKPPKQEEMTCLGKGIVRCLNEEPQEWKETSSIGMSRPYTEDIQTIKYKDSICIWIYKDILDYFLSSYSCHVYNCSFAKELNGIDLCEIFNAIKYNRISSSLNNIFEKEILDKELKDKFIKMGCPDK